MTMWRNHGSFHQAPNLSNQRNTVPFIIHCFKPGSLAVGLQNALLKMKVVHLEDERTLCKVSCELYFDFVGQRVGVGAFRRTFEGMLEIICYF